MSTCSLYRCQRNSLFLEPDKSLIPGLSNVFWDQFKSVEIIPMPEKTWARVGPLWTVMVNMLVMFSGAEVPSYSEPDGMGSWSVHSSTLCQCRYCTLTSKCLSNTFLNKRLLYSLVSEAFSVCFWHWIKWTWNLCCVNTPVASAGFWYSLGA